jgi:transposase
MRLLCAILRKKSRTIDEIAAFTGLNRRTVHSILWRFNERGLLAQGDMERTGRPPKLTRTQRVKLIELIEKGRPRKKNHEPWTNKKIRDQIRLRFGVKYSSSHVRELVSAAGYSISHPRKKHHAVRSGEKDDYLNRRLACWRNLISYGR